MPARLFLVICPCVLTGLVGGCAALLPSCSEEGIGHSPLRPAKPSCDSMAVEIFIARLPGDDTLTESLWQRIDEQLIPVPVRRALARNGFRAGIVGNSVPDELMRILRIQEAEPKDPDAVAQLAEQGEDTKASNVVAMTDDYAITRQWRRLRECQRSEINVSDIYPSLPVLINDQDGLQGRTYAQVQGVYAIRAILEPQRQVTLEVIPELQYGPAKTRYVAGEGPYWRLDISRDREVFEQLRIPATLRPGQMLVLGCDSASEGSLGHHFHRVSAAKGSGRRLVVIRLAEVPDANALDLPELPTN